MPIGERGIDQGPEMLGGLEFGRVWRQKQQVDMLGGTQLDTAVPAGPIEDQDDLLGGARADLAGEGDEFHLKERDRDRGGQVEDGAAQGRVHEADQIAPGVAMLDRRGRAAAVKTPDFVEDRFETNPMLIDRPEFDLGSREGGRDCLDKRL